MNIGVLPIAGIPLPLISYGGSATITTLAALGLAQSVVLRRPMVVHQPQVAYPDVFDPTAVRISS
jgi:cell division protein FtsW (lipid II flippase)